MLMGLQMQNRAVVMVIGNLVSASEIERALSPKFLVERCTGVADLSERCAERSVISLVVDLTGPLDDGMRRLVDECRRLLPTAPLIAFCPVRVEHARDVMEIARLQLHDFVPANLPDAASQLVRSVERARSAGARRVVVDVLRSRFPSLPVELTDVLLAHCGPRLSVGEAARECGMSARTLARRLQHSGCPAPKRVLAGFRTLYAAYLVAHLTVPARVAARLSGFTSAGHMFRTLHRATALPAGEFRALVDPVGYLGERLR